MFTQILIQSLGAALVYAMGFFGTEAFLCLTAEYGCQTRGDIAAVVIVIVGFIVITAMVLGAYLVMLKRVADRGGAGTKIRRLRLLLFLCSLGYGILIAVLFFGIVGEFSSFSMERGFWVHAIAGGICFGGYVVFLSTMSKKVSQ